jgi:hypothetical protein
MDVTLDPSPYERENYRKLINEKLHYQFLEDKIKKDEMDGACRAQGRYTCIQNFDEETIREGKAWEIQG